MTSIFMATQDNTVRQQAIAYDRASAIASGRSLKGSLWLITTSVTTKPKLSKEQRVSFVGNIGTIKSCRTNSDTGLMSLRWTWVQSSTWEE